MDKLSNFFARRISRPNEFESQTSADLPPRLIDKHPELIDRERLRVFQTWANKKGEGGLFGKLVDNVRFVDKSDFENSLLWMSKAAVDFVGEGDYLLVVHRRGHSGEWLAKQLNIKPPIDVFDAWQMESGEVAKRHLKNIKILYPDDGCYSGAQATAVFNSAIKNHTINPENIGMFYVGMTNFAENEVKRRIRPAVIKSKYNIPTINEMFNSQETAKLQKLFNGWSGSYDQAVLTFLWSKIPDNFFGGLKSSIGQHIEDPNAQLKPNHYLFNDWKGGPFSPPYKKVK